MYILKAPGRLFTGTSGFLEAYIKVTMREVRSLLNERETRPARDWQVRGA